jgi:CHAT domain-containing protein
VPDNQLGYLSFDALITELTDAPTYSKLNYLIHNYTILQHQSIGLYINQEPGGANVNKQYIGFAPDFSKEQLSGVESRQLRSDLQPLPFAKREIEVISTLLGGEIETGLKASESNFKLKSSNYNMLHVASHAVINEENPLYSMLVFARGDSIENEDGNLYSFEIYGMNLNCDLVTLSACNTGSGKYFEGEGIFSLGRAFLLAGSKSVLTSYWEVSDQSTSAIMESFYRNLLKGNNKPEALRQAKLEYLKNADALTANPYYWAGFVYMGTPDVVYGSNKMYYWLVGGLLVLILVFFGVRRTFSSKV